MPARGGFTQGKTWWPKLYPWLLLAALVVVLDQLSKLVIERVFNYGDSRPVTSFFNLVLTYN
ncbi:MAG: signal peptidase II, partial [Burkholderiaceae bacterium]